MPNLVKPATVTCYLTEGVARAIVESKILPLGTFSSSAAALATCSTI